MPNREIDNICVKTIKMMCVDMVERAKSGHPGAPMGMADFVYVLWKNFLRFNPQAPDWMFRDRFIMSGGHASSLLYSMLHLWGYELPLDELKKFRQWGSLTPGHPEYGEIPGVEFTTGPLGQGLAAAVGMAMSAKCLQARFPDAPIKHNVFVTLGEGDLMEGVSQEAISLAGHWCLDNLVVLFDQNNITIEGPADLAFTEDVRAGFEARGWAVKKARGNDHEHIENVISGALFEYYPTLIICETVIGDGSPNKAGDSSCHGAPLGVDEVRATKRALKWSNEKNFFVPDQVRTRFDELKNEKFRQYRQWHREMQIWRDKNPNDSRVLSNLLQGDNSEKTISAPDCSKISSAATRVHSGKIIQELSSSNAQLMGGCADLAPSCKTIIKSSSFIGLEGDGVESGFIGRNIHYGVREHAMAAIMNGIAVYGWQLPFGGTFLVFSDYMRPAIRLAAMMQLRVVYVFTHDSFWVGEDGPTHQPIEHLPALRLIPGITVIRPANFIETEMAWKWALTEANGPVALALSRQTIPEFELPDDFKPEQVLKGAYEVYNSGDGGGTKVNFLATGSEVSTSIQCAQKLSDENIPTRVVSVPSVEIFKSQAEEYISSILDHDGLWVSVEASSQDWSSLIGRNALMVRIDHFGASAPGSILADKFGFTAEAIYKKVKNKL
ncbi:MAG: transketolase [Candidatus Magasanikbacteria bacterium]|nr:transketolase [Candidatus Magasanikbacteria bacterium]